MKQKELTYLLQEPSRITAAQTAEMKGMLERYPFFQAARAVWLKGLKDQKSLHYNKALKTAAAYTTDRSILFDFITSDQFNQNTIADHIRHQEQIQQDEPQDPESKEENRTLDQALKMKVQESERIFDPDLFSPSAPKLDTQKGSSPKDPEKNLNLGAPLSFQKSESHSFSEWLQLTSAEPVDRKNQSAHKAGYRSRKFELIDEFILKSPKIKPAKSGKKTNLAENTDTAPEALMTETLARVYLEQKNYKKAIQAYKILSLKNPEKSGFFADQIRAIKKLQENNS